MIQGLSHLTFIVRDLDKMARTMVEVLGGRGGLFFWQQDVFDVAGEVFCGGWHLDCCDGRREFAVSDL
jgi:catechol 2,3-dioxygenase-like lactoylglutathione lyase family enzyme